jgi:class 3 adenylate cyclase
MTAQELVKEINTYFSAFDGIIQKYGLEKIKTIGDAYIAAGGLPEKKFSNSTKCDRGSYRYATGS